MKHEVKELKPRILSLNFGIAYRKLVVLSLLLATAVYFTTKLAFSIPFGVDIEFFRKATILTLEGRDPYGSIGFVFPPPSLAMWIPFSFINLQLTKYLWFVLNMAFLMGCIGLIIRLIKKTSVVDYLLIGAIILAPKAVWISAIYGNADIFVAFLTVASYYLLKQKREYLAGVLMGIACLVKPLPALLIPYLAWRRQWKAFLSSVMTCITAFTCSLVILGLPMWASYFDRSGRFLIPGWRGSLIRIVNTYVPSLFPFSGLFIAIFFIATVFALLRDRKLVKASDFFVLLTTELFLIGLWHHRLAVLPPFLALFTYETELSRTGGVLFWMLFFYFAILPHWRLSNILRLHVNLAIYLVVLPLWLFVLLHDKLKTRAITQAD